VELRVLLEYVRTANGKKGREFSPKLKLYTRSAFVEKVMYTAIQARAAPPLLWNFRPTAWE
jgi:hypothetical protein